MMFLELIDYLSGVQIVYPQEMFDIYQHYPEEQLKFDESEDEEEN